MKLYKCHKLVHAAQIVAVNDAVVDGRTGMMLKLDDGADFFAPAGMLARYTPVAGDYLVKYVDGYQSISPRKAFEEGYTLLEEQPK